MSKQNITKGLNSYIYKNLRFKLIQSLVYGIIDASLLKV